MNKKIDKGYYHEAADRLYIIQANIEDHLQKHPAFQDKKSRKMLNKIQDLLSELYQIKGAKI